MSEIILPLRKSALWSADTFRTSAWIEHVPFAFWLIDVLRPCRVVELGTYHGMSYLAFCQAIKALQLNTKATAIDTWQGDDHAGELSSSTLALLKAVHDPRYATFSTLMQSTFADAASRFDNGSIDLLHIDGLHTYEAVKEDFETWLPKVSKKRPSVILLHDTQVRTSGFGVYRLWSELVQEYPSFEFYHGHGLGVLSVGLGLPKELQALFDSPKKEHSNRIRMQFENLGRRMSIDWIYKEEPLTRSYRQLRRAVRHGVKQLRPIPF